MSGAPAFGLDGRFAKTEAGRNEIRQRALPLSRPARNLLLIIDAGRSAADWLALVKGSGADELQALLAAGLVAAAGDAAVDAAPPRMSLAQALETKGFEVLRQRLAAEARPRLGALKGYRLGQEVERCVGATEVRALAQRLVSQVREADGDAAAIALAQRLLAPD